MALQLDIANLSLAQNQDRYGKLIISLVNALVARGWTVEGSGDGLAAFQNSGQTAGPYNVFTSGVGYVTGGTEWNVGGGANSFTNLRAWIRIREPSPSVREFIFQRSNNSSLNGYALYMAIGVAYEGYLAGGASANTVPTSAGATQFINHTVFNSTGGVWGTYNVNASISSPNTLIANVMISDVVRDNNVWPFYFTVYDSTAAEHRMSWMYESLAEAPAGDAHPFVLISDTFVLTFGTPLIAPAMTLKGRNAKGTVVTTLRVFNHASSYGVFPVVTMNANPLDSKVRALPLYVADVGADGNRYKGRMEHFRLNMHNRNYPDTHNLAGADAKVYLGCMLADWETGVTPGT